MSGIYKTGIVKSSAFNDSTIGLMNPSNSASITPTAATANICLSMDITGFQKGKTYGVELLIAWSGFKTNAASDFNAFFQGAAYSGGDWSWSIGNPMSEALRTACDLKGTLLGADSGSKFISTKFTVTADMTGLGFGVRFDKSNGTGNFVYKNLRIAPIESFISSKNDGGKIFNSSILMNDFIEI